MGWERLVAGFLVLGVAGAGVAWLWAHAPGAEGVPGVYPVQVVGPDGRLFDDDVAVLGDATAYDALLSAARAGPLTVEVADHPHYEPCGTYVRSIGGFEERGAEGWVYEVRRDGAWLRPAYGACAFGLQPGDAVVWRWGTEGG